MAEHDSDITEPIVGCIDDWHRQMRGELPGGLDAILHEDCTFLSPIVFTPQQGREVTKLYLTAAGGTLGGNEDGDVAAAVASDDAPAGGFRYVKEVLDGHHAVLEFETTIQGKYANGVDIITCDDEGLITEFKVMMRPLQAINAVHEQMRAMLERLQG
jgi:hypothetical protein